MVKDFVVVAGAPNLTTISGQMMTFQVVREDPPVAVHHHLVAAHPMVVVVAHHPSVTDHRPLVNAHHRTVVVVVARLLAVGTGKPHKITQITQQSNKCSSRYTHPCISSSVAHLDFEVACDFPDFTSPMMLFSPSR
jgi:hypothetical protein